MTCRHLHMNTKQIHQLGGPPILHQTALCAVKMQGLHEQLAVYNALFERGLEGSRLSDICPVASSGQWHKCPFAE